MYSPANWGIINGMSIKDEILRKVDEKIKNNDWDNKSDIPSIIKEKKFYLAHGVEAYNNFINYELNKEELRDALEGIESSPGNTTAATIRKILSKKEYSFNKNNRYLNLLNTLIVYLDKSGKERPKLNKYKPPRSISNAVVRQNNWYKQLSKHKLKKNDNLSPVVLNSINYITNHINNISIVSNDAREQVARNIFESSYQNKTLVKQIESLFAEYKDILGNQENYTIFCSRLLYENDIQKLWNWKGSPPKTPHPMPANEVQHPLNRILYGPPGTGKTRETARLAVEIVTGKKFSDNQEHREEILKLFRNFMKEEHIDFVTFHQSYGYEEFVEGIKPVIEEADDSNGADIMYEVKRGIFRQICERAKNVQSPDSAPEKDNATLEIDASQNVWIVKLGTPEIYKKEAWEKGLKKDCFKGGFISAGRPNKKTNQTNFDNFVEQCKAGDIVIASENRSGEIMNFCAVGKLIRNEHYIDNHPNRKGFLCWPTMWLWSTVNKDEYENLKDYGAGVGYARGFIFQRRDDINIKKLLQNLVVVNSGKKQNNKPRYVLIIDEINRGNISKILGELITLLEDDKRTGGKEQLKTTLPYSGEKFSVPDNLYIIGTMNTADRSIAFFDTALRRRFEFKEMMPDHTLPEISTDVGGVDLQRLLKTINGRIRNELGRDYQIGHSYFMNIKSMEHLAKVFRNKIRPLLDEYFHDQRKLIAKVLEGSKLFDEQTLEWTEDDSAFKEPANYTGIREES